MAMTPTQIATAARTAEPGTPIGRKLASDGRKLPWFLAAARKPADRNYAPRYDLG